MTTQEILELAGHRDVPPWVMKLVADCVAKERKEFAVHAVDIARRAIAEEREACAKVCEDSVPTYLKDGERWLKGQNGKPDVRLKEIAPNLEAAWEAEQLLKNGSVLESYSVQHRCAELIRARGQQ
jgi:hypothetical protein